LIAVSVVYHSCFSVYQRAAYKHLDIIKKPTKDIIALRVERGMPGNDNNV